MLQGGGPPNYKWLIIPLTIDNTYKPNREMGQTCAPTERVHDLGHHHKYDSSNPMDHSLFFAT